MFEGDCCEAEGPEERGEGDGCKPHYYNGLSSLSVNWKC